MKHALIEPVSMLARLVRAGTTLHAAIHDVAHRHPDSLFLDITLALANGVPLAEAVSTIESRNDDEQLVLFVLCLAAEIGGDVPAQIDSLLNTLGDRQSAHRERLAHASAALASTRLLTVVPFIAVTLLVMSDRRLLHTYVGSVAGIVCVVAGLLLNAGGRIWTRRLIGRP